MSEIAKDLHTEHMVINMGPSHPVTHGTVKFLVTLDGETIEDLKVEIGYLHRGFEKMCESGTWYQVFPYTDRLNYVSPLINNVGYALAVEKLIGIDVPERCKYVRVIACELSRIADHMTNVAAGGLELGAFTAFLYFVEARELVWDLIEMLCGARVTTNYVRIGGLKNDLPDGFKQKTLEVFKRCRVLWSDVNKLLTKNRVFIDRVRDVGTMPAEEAIAYGFTGPCLRACGVPYDVRKANPYLVYDRMDFEVPIGETGDNFDKYLVRMEEINQSMRIVEQALEQLPGGPINVDMPYYRWQSKDDIYNRIDSLIFHFKTVIEGIKPPPGEVYLAVESGNGELGFYLVSDGSGKPYKCRVRPPCFPLTAAMPRMMKGRLIADIVPTFDMINMIGGECDR
ncbi:NADH-quinone oxidoreductase subunit D [Desulfoferrobacter suflitae]|uniref:NADH-quinone oxidoreductase subunit D n=1 Tax=Desulfoferrobacter suflitae TaxID=2865782 RepID=UPI002164C1D9|nr:NADH-quinone oxidoreductase subunit D [Desulfoferrobacter suflitae]MCK8601772.1 NADH-quinone oxidoreductase subunit D [Desulfoferrobacter suflitae]